MMAGGGVARGLQAVQGVLQNHRNGWRKRNTGCFVNHIRQRPLFNQRHHQEKSTPFPVENSDTVPQTAA